MDDILTLVSADLLRYKVLPLDAFERAMLINTTLLPKWVYRGMFVFNDRLLAAIDSKLRDFVTVAKNIERTHNATHVHTPSSMGGVGVKQAFWAFRGRYVTMVQSALTHPTSQLR